MWGGFDPARSGDFSCFVIVAPPQFAAEKYRVLRVINWQGMNFRWQAKQIEELFKQYNFTYLGVDVTGIGRAFLRTSSTLRCAWRRLSATTATRKINWC